MSNTVAPARIDTRPSFSTTLLQVLPVNARAPDGELACGVAAEATGAAGDWTTAPNTAVSTELGPVGLVVVVVVDVGAVVDVVVDVGAVVDVVVVDVVDGTVVVVVDVVVDVGAVVDVVDVVDGTVVVVVDVGAVVEVVEVDVVDVDVVDVDVVDVVVVGCSRTVDAQACDRLKNGVSLSSSDLPVSWPMLASPARSLSIVDV